MLSKQSIDHQAATKNTYSSKKDISQAIKETIFLPKTTHVIICKYTSLSFGFK